MAAASDNGSLGNSHASFEGLASWLHRTGLAVRVVQRLIVLTVMLLVPFTASAHIGSPNVFYDGEAGPYPIRVVIRPPGVVPGLAEISVRVLAGSITKVSALPVHWEVGTKGAPPPDEAKPIPGQTNLFNAQLWLMDFGAYSVFVKVEGAQGSGTAIVPLNSVATARLKMPRTLAAIFLSVGLVLFLILINIVGAAVRESVLPPGVEPDRRRRWRARFMMTGATVVVALMLLTLTRWWEKVDQRFLRRLYKPSEITTTVTAHGSGRMLQLLLDNPSWRWRDFTRLVPDHGKLMHVFLMREPGLESFAHLHPMQTNDTRFSAALPPIPAGTYRVYADITHESGFAQTLLSEVVVPDLLDNGAATNSEAAPDSDDSWHVTQPLVASHTDSTPVDSAAERSHSKRKPLENGFAMTWQQEGPLLEGDESPLNFVVLDSTARPAVLDPYMGMPGHAIVRHEDGSVFTHLHPRGTISMASQQLFAARETGLRVSTYAGPDPFCGRIENALSFPYAFPKAGRYRVWVQVKIGGKIMTGAFDADVSRRTK